MFVCGVMGWSLVEVYRFLYEDQYWRIYHSCNCKITDFSSSVMEVILTQYRFLKHCQGKHFMISYGKIKLFLSNFLSSHLFHQYHFGAKHLKYVPEGGADGQSCQQHRAIHLIPLLGPATQGTLIPLYRPSLPPITQHKGGGMFSELPLHHAKPDVLRLEF